MTIKGIDVSGYQSATYSLTGYDFVIVKATQSTTYINPRHTAQVQRARDGGRVVGHYHFLVAGVDVQKQAEYFVTHAAPKAGEFLACDWELDPTSKTNPTSAQKDAFIKAVKKLEPGLKVGLYTGQNQWTTRDSSGYYGDFLWIARYGATSPGVTAPVTIWQYTSTPLDTNAAYFDSRTAMAAWAAGTEPDMPLTTDDINKVAAAAAKAVLTTDGIIAAPADAPDIKTNPFWALQSYIKDTNAKVRAVQATEAAQNATIAKLVVTVAALAANSAAIDPKALVAEIQAAIDNVTVHITTS